MIEHDASLYDRVQIGADTYFAQTSCIHHDFKQVAHGPQKVVHTRTLEDVEVMPMGLDFDGNDEVCLLHSLRCVRDPEKYEDMDKNTL